VSWPNPEYAAWEIEQLRKRLAEAAAGLDATERALRDRADEQEAAEAAIRTECRLEIYHAIRDAIGRIEADGRDVREAIAEELQAGQISKIRADACLRVLDGASAAEWIERDLDRELLEEIAADRDRRQSKAEATDGDGKLQPAGDVADVAALQRTRDRIRAALVSDGPLADALRVSGEQLATADMIRRAFGIGMFVVLSELVKAVGITCLVRAMPIVNTTAGLPRTGSIELVILAIDRGLTLSEFLAFPDADSAALTRWLAVHGDKAKP
jgi:hypothetical protein